MIFKKNSNSHVVYTVGAPVLRKNAAPVSVVDEKIHQLAADMIEAMHRFNGIGLAAPQYGESLRLVVIDVPGDDNTGSPGEALLLPQMPLTLINPEIVTASEARDTRDEGCLSVPGLYAPVCRACMPRSAARNGWFCAVSCSMEHSLKSNAAVCLHAVSSMNWIIWTANCLLTG